MTISRAYRSWPTARALARRAFAVSSHYDTAIFTYFNEDGALPVFKRSEMKA